MGCNFYILDRKTGVRKHIGKRAAAGQYCWDCNVTLCKNGNSFVHEHGVEWLDFCPYCAREESKESLEDSASGRELGFNKLRPTKKTGIKSCSSFNWAMYPKDLALLFASNPQLRIVSEDFPNSDPKIYDLDGFKREILSECPIRFFSFVGLDFD